MSGYDFEFTIRLSLKPRNPDKKEDRDAMQPTAADLQAQQRAHEETKQVERSHDDTPAFVPDPNEHKVNKKLTARALDVARNAADKVNAEYDRCVAAFGTRAGHEQALGHYYLQLREEGRVYVETAVVSLIRVWNHCGPFRAEIVKGLIAKIVVELIVRVLKEV